MKDLLLVLAAGEKPSLRPLARTPLFFPEATPLEEIRREMQRKGIHLVIVTGEEGAVTGSLTLEDVVEEFIGEIRDEQDAGEVPPFQRLDDGFEADGRAMIDMIEREAGLVLDAPAGVETIGGLVATLFGRVPSPGDTLDVAGYRLQILSVRDHRITRIRAAKLPPPEA